MKLFLLLLGFIIINAQELKKQFSLTGNDSYYFNRIEDCKVIRNRIYVLDSKNYCFFIFDDNGKFIKSIGRKGQGPGEFNKMLNEIIIKNDSLIVGDYDVVSTLNYFDINGNFIKKKYINSSIIRSSLFKNKAFFTLSQNIHIKNPNIIFGDLHNESFNEILIPNLHFNPYKNECENFSLNNGNLILVFRYLNKLLMYSPEGKFIKDFSLSELPKEIPEKYDEKSYKELSQILPNAKNLKYTTLIRDKRIYSYFAYDKYDNIYIQGGDYSKKGREEIYVFDKNANFKYSFVLPNKKEYILHIDNQMNLYTKSEQHTILNKYKLTIK